MGNERWQMGPIPCVSLWQPWASLVAGGHKRIETRSWQPNLELPCVLAIHATAKCPAVTPLVNLPGEGDHYRLALLALGCRCEQTGPDLYFAQAHGLPRSAVLCLTRLVRVLPTIPLCNEISPQERAFGDYRPGRCGWVFDRIVRIHPVPARGQRGVWEWHAPADVAALALEMMEDKSDGQ